MSNRQNKAISSRGQPNPALQAMGAVAAKAATQEAGMEAAYLRNLSKKALLKANEG